LYNSPRRVKWHQNYPIWKLFWVIKTKTLIHVFVSITKTMFKLDSFGAILFVSLSWEKCYIYFFLNAQKIQIIFLSINKFWLNQKFETNVFVVIHRRNFTRNYLNNYNNSEGTVKQKMLNFSWTFRISTKCDFCNFSLQYIGLPWIRKAFLATFSRPDWSFK
jgi:uncharacterized protein YlbG (UPF0298 family)